MKPKFIMLGGSIGVGKTTLAYGLKKHIPDLVIVESDTIRRELLGFPLDYFMNNAVDGSFSEESNRRVHSEMGLRVQDALLKGKPTLQAVAATSPENYHKIADEHRGTAEFKGIFLRAPEAVILERLKKRKSEREGHLPLSVELGHASDADEKVLNHLPISNDVPYGWFTIDATQPAETVLAKALAFIECPDETLP